MRNKEGKIENEPKEKYWAYSVVWYAGSGERTEQEGGGEEKERDAPGR